MDKVKLFLKNNSPDQLASVPKPADIRGRGGAGKASDLPSQARATKGAPKSSRKAGAKKGSSAVCAQLALKNDKDFNQLDELAE
ncbi:hypothetical protein H4Q26_010945 [Puccinia striiformis f. sp. tritici PST-130]|nr:hypothetical protein H4Q26_010945 [Puccinia striiformis f. sp. tritici PST-130]